MTDFEENFENENLENLPTPAEFYGYEFVEKNRARNVKDIY